MKQAQSTRIGSGLEVISVTVAVVLGYERVRIDSSFGSLNNLVAFDASVMATVVATPCLSTNTMSAARGLKDGGPTYPPIE